MAPLTDDSMRKEGFSQSFIPQDVPSGGVSFLSNQSSREWRAFLACLDQLGFFSPRVPFFVLIFF